MLSADNMAKPVLEARVLQNSRKSESRRPAGGRRPDQKPTMIDGFLFVIKNLTIVFVRSRERYGFFSR
jgi:hypothetical protein